MVAYNTLALVRRAFLNTLFAYRLTFLGLYRRTKHFTIAPGHYVSAWARVATFGLKHLSLGARR